MYTNKKQLTKVLKVELVPQLHTENDFLNIMLTWTGKLYNVIDNNNTNILIFLENISWYDN